MIDIGVKGRAFLLAFIPMSFTAILLSTLFIRNQLQDTEFELDNHGNSIARHLAYASEYGVFSGNIESLRSLADAALDEMDVQSITIIDISDTILVQLKQKNTSNNRNIENNKQQNSNRVFRQPIILHTVQISDIDSFESQIEHDKSNEIIGWVTAEISPERLLERGYSAINNTLFISAIGVVISILLAILIGRSLTKPILDITSSVRDIENGKIDTDIILQSSGELGELEKGLQSMLQTIRLTQHDLQNKINDATLELRNSLDLVEKKNVDLKEARKLALRASEAKSTFLANISHEIRTPLNGILGFTRILKNICDARKEHEYLNTIEESSNNLLHLINDLLDISKIEAGKLSVNNTAFNLHECIENAIILMAPSIQEKGLDIISIFYNDTPQEIIAPRERIRQVLINLIGNAVKFSNKGTIAIRTMLELHNNDSCLIKISVTDQGIGIPENEHKNLFIPFTQLDNTSTRKYGGTGLGLAISKSLTEAMGGNIGIENNEIEGSTFWFTFNCTLQTPYSNIQERSRIFNNDLVYLYDSNELSFLSVFHDLSNLGASVEKLVNLDRIDEILKNIRDGALFVLSLSGDEINNENTLKLIENINNQKSNNVLILINRYLAGKKLPDRFTNSVRILSKPYQLSVLRDAILELVNSNSPIISKSLDMPEHSFDGNIKRLSLEGMKILIVEDNQINTKLVETVLREEGVITSNASNGKKAVDIFLSEEFDVILMDIHMPILNGIDATKIIRAMESENQHTPIIGLTANAYIDDKDKYLSAGIDGILIKPIAIDDLLHEIRKYYTKYKKTINMSIDDGLTRSTNTDTYSHKHKSPLGINKELTSSLYDMLVMDLPDTSSQLKEAYISKNWELLREYIHKFLGGITYCNVPDLLNATLDVKNCLNNNVKDIDSHFNLLLKEIEKHINKNTI